MRFFALLIIFLPKFLLSQEVETLQAKDSTQTKAVYAQFLIDYLENVEFNTVLDIGSGDLELIAQVVNRFPNANYVFEDIDSSILDEQRLLDVIEYLNLEAINQKNISLLLGQPYYTGAEKNNFDLVLVSGLIHEIDSINIFFNELSRVLKPDGQLIIYDALYYEKPTKHHGCHNPYLTTLAFKNLAQNSYFKNVNVTRLVGLKDGKSRKYETVISTWQPQKH